MTTSIIPGSIGAIARNNKQSLAETFIGCDVIILVDTSGSMGACDSTGGRSRYDQACYELAQLQGNLPGKIAVLSFATQVVFCPNGEPLFLNGGTRLTEALEFAKVADVEGIQFIVISDGEPNKPNAALMVAREYNNKIDTIYVGPEERPSGRDFLQQLAKASGGQSVTADRVTGLEDKVNKLLVAG